MDNSGQNGIGAASVPFWKTDGVSIANIYEWPNLPTNSDLVGRSVALIYSTDSQSLLLSTDGENWTQLGNAVDDAAARNAIGWPYTDTNNISTRLVALENAGVTEPISAPDGIQAGLPAPTTSTPAPLTGRQIESLSGLPYEYSALDLWPKNGEYRVRFWAPNLSDGVPGLGVIGLSAIYFSNDILIGAYDVLGEMGNAVYKQVPTLSVRNAIDDQVIVKSTDSNVLYPTSFSENTYVSTKTQLTRNPDGSFTCAANGRVFQVSYQIAWQSEATGLRYAWIEKNDGTVYAMNIANPINGDVTIQSGTSTLTLDSGESFTIKCKHTCSFDISLINETSVAGIPAGYANTVCISML